MTKMNRTLKRIGEEKRRDHERRRDESKTSKKETSPKQTDENNNKVPGSNRKEDKENRTLKSLAQKL